MGRFINGQHVSWTSELGPNERFGVEDEMSFQNLAMKLKNKDNDSPFRRSVKSNNSVTDAQKAEEQAKKAEELAKKEEIAKNQLLYELFLKLKAYNESREEAVALIKEFAEQYPDADYTDNHSLAKLLCESIPVKKLLEYYSNTPY